MLSSYKLPSKALHHSHSLGTKLPTVSTPRATPLNCLEVDEPHLSIYEGSKFYWRSRLNVDISIILHSKEQVLEVISYDTDQSIDLPRIFLALQPLLTAIEDEVRGKLAAATPVKGTPNAVHPSEREITKTTLANHILSRISFEANPENPKSQKPVFATNVLASIMESDTEEQCAPVVLDTVPTTITPFHIRRRRKTTAADFERSLSDYQETTQRLTEALSKAQRMNFLTELSVNAFKGNRVAHYPQKGDKGITNIPLARFKWAASKVLQLNYVEKVRKILEAREAAARASARATFPSPAPSLRKLLSPSAAGRKTPQLSPQTQQSQKSPVILPPIATTVPASKPHPKILRASKSTA